MLGQLRDVTAPYSAAEGFVYDRFIAPAVVELIDKAGAELLRRLTPGARVLEVGSGGGQLACALTADRPDLEWTGVDLSPHQVERARVRARAAGSSPTFQQGDAMALDPHPDGTYDGVVSVASIKHWPDPARGLRECTRVLRPGGTLVVAEVDRGCTFEDARRFVSRWRIPPPMRPLALMFFRTWVAGRSLDTRDLERLSAELPIQDVDVRRIPGTPGLLLVGIRAGESG